MSGLTVRQVWPALVTLFDGAGVAGLQVGRGGLYDPGVNYLAVGWNGGEAAPLAGSRQLADYGASQDAESFDVTCLLSFWRGDADEETVTDALLDAFDLLDAALKTDPRLGVAAVTRAAITEWDLTPDLDETGDEAAMRFVVTVTAFK